MDYEHIMITLPSNIEWVEYEKELEKASKDFPLTLKYQHYLQK